MGKWSRVLLAVAALSLPAVVSAQIVDPAGHPLGANRRVSIGLSIPLGGAAEASGKPQLELRAIVDHRAAQAGNRESVGWLPRTHPREARIGMTLAERPRLTIDGRELPKADDKLGISTVAWVAIGVVAVAVVGGLVLIDRIEDSSE